MWHGERYRRRWRSVALFLVALNAALQSRVHTSVTLGIASAPELRELANNIAPATHRAWRTTPADFEKSNYKLVPRGTSSGKREEKPGDDFASSVVPAQRWFRQYATLVPVPSRAYGPSEQHSMPGRSLRQAIVRSRRWPPTAPPPLYFFPPQRCRFSIYKVKKRKEGVCWLLESHPPIGWNRTLVGARPATAIAERQQGARSARCPLPAAVLFYICTVLSGSNK